MQKQIDLKDLRSSSCNCGYCFEYSAVFKTRNVPSILNFFYIYTPFQLKQKTCILYASKNKLACFLRCSELGFFFHNQENELFPRIKRPNFLITFLEQAPVNKLTCCKKSTKIIISVKLCENVEHNGSQFIGQFF